MFFLQTTSNAIYKKTNMSYVSIDVGSGLTKFANKEQRSLFPSLVGKCSEKDSFKLGVNEHQLLDIDGQFWMTGTAAQGYIEKTDLVVSTKKSWSETKGHLILIYSAIAYLHPSGFKGKMKIVTGLPIKKYVSEVENFKNKLIGIHKFKTSNFEYEVEFLKNTTIVIPQVVGLHFSNCLKNEKGDWHNKKVSYIDPGTETIGYAVMDEGIFQSVLSDGDNVGLAKLAIKIKGYLKSEHKWEAESDTVILKALTNGYIEIFEGNKPSKLNLIEIAQQFVPEVYKEPINNIMKKWNDAKDMHVVVSSGGGKYIIDAIKRRIPHATLLNKDIKSNDKYEAIFDVVEGYSVYAESVLE
jgi:hypothetical protein